MTHRLFWIQAISLVIASLIAPAAMAQDNVSRMTKEELKARLGDEALVVVDVRTKSDWDHSERKIKGAVRVEPRDAGVLPDKYGKDKTLVFYCN